MPGFGMGMQMGLSMQMSQRLQQRLEQRLSLDLALSLQTGGERDAATEVVLLKKYRDELMRGVYSGATNFQDRCMKRVKKKDRTEPIKTIVSSLRTCITAMKPEDLSSVTRLIEYGIRSYEEEHIPPSVQLEQLATIAAKRPALKDPIFSALESKIAIPNYGSVLLQLSEDGRVSDGMISGAMERLSSADARVLDGLVNSLIESLPEKPTNTSFGFAVDALAEFEVLLHGTGAHSIRPAVTGLLGRSDAEDAIHKYASIPPSLLAALNVCDASDAVITKVNALCAEKRVVKGRDVKRHLLSGAHYLSTVRERSKLIQHAVSMSENAEQLEDLLGAVGESLRSRRGIDWYDYTATSALQVLQRKDEAMKARMFGGDVVADAVVKNISAEQLKKNLAAVPDKFFEMMASLRGIYEHKYPQGVTLLRQLYAHVAAGDFRDWRYSHEKASLQLLELAGCKAWMNNIVERKVLSAGDEFRQKMEGVRRLGNVARDIFVEKFEAEPTNKYCADLQQQLFQIERLLRSDGSDKALLARQAADRRHCYAMAKAVELFAICEGSANVTQNFFAEKVRDSKFALYHSVMRDALKILDSDAVRKVQTVTVEETDDVTTALNVGVEPVLSCQRWTESTSYNHCLLAYVLDANKKVLRMRNQHGTVIARAIERLLPFAVRGRKKGPLLLLEREYATEWSDDHCKALVWTVFKKAALIAQELNEPVRVGYTDRRGSYERAFCEVAKEAGIKDVRTANLGLCLPESLNAAEYSDALGGVLKSGAKVDATVHYLTVGEEE